MIFTDRVHLVSDKLGRAGKAELRAFAEKIGLARCWYRRGHYDLPGYGRMLQAALAAGAQITSRRECARYRRRTMTGVEWHLQRIL